MRYVVLTEWGHPKHLSLDITNREEAMVYAGDMVNLLQGLQDTQQGVRFMGLSPSTRILLSFIDDRMNPYEPGNQLKIRKDVVSGIASDGSGLQAIDQSMFRAICACFPGLPTVQMGVIPYTLTARRIKQGNEHNVALLKENRRGTGRPIIPILNAHSFPVDIEHFFQYPVTGVPLGHYFGSEGDAAMRESGMLYVGLHQFDGNHTEVIYQCLRDRAPDVRLIIGGDDHPYDILRYYDPSIAYIVGPYIDQCIQMGMMLTFGLDGEGVPFRQFHKAAQVEIAPYEKVDVGCDCMVCIKYQQGYIQHLWHTDEMLGIMLVAIHNYHKMDTFVRRLDQEYQQGTLAAYREKMSPVLSKLMPLDAALQEAVEKNREGRRAAWKKQ